MMMMMTEVSKCWSVCWELYTHGTQGALMKKMARGSLAKGKWKKKKKALTLNPEAQCVSLRCAYFIRMSSTICKRSAVPCGVRVHVCVFVWYQEPAVLPACRVLTSQNWLLMKWVFVFFAADNPLNLLLWPHVRRRVFGLVNAAAVASLLVNSAPLFSRRWNRSMSEKSSGRSRTVWRHLAKGEQGSPEGWNCSSRPKTWRHMRWDALKQMTPAKWKNNRIMKAAKRSWNQQSSSLSFIVANQLIAPLIVILCLIIGE